MSGILLKSAVRIAMVAGVVFVMHLFVTVASANDCKSYFKTITSWVNQKHDNFGTCEMENVPADSEYPADSIPYKLRNGKELCTKNRKIEKEYLWENGKRISGINFRGSKTRMTLKFKDSFIPSGPVLIYQNGKLFCEVPVNREGRPDGIVREYSPEDKLVHGFRMIGGKREGGFVEYKDDGKLKSFACEGKSVFDGDAERCGFNGKPAIVKLPNGRTLTHLKGKLTVEETVRADGARSVKKYPDTNNNLVIFAEYHKDGALFKNYTKKDGQLDGEFKEFYDDGAVAEKGIAEHGGIIELKQYFKNGLPKLEARLARDRELCEARLFAPNGKREREGSFKSLRKSVAWDVPHGQVRTYHDDGSIADEGNYINGTRDGSHIFYLKDGKKEEIDYVNGKSKKMRVFDMQGALIKEFDIYDDGSKKEIFNYKDNRNTRFPEVF